MELPAKKSLGQHFLKSEVALAQIIKAAHLKNGEIVLEIGPGTGILTEKLLETGAQVVAIEKDDRALGLLREKFAQKNIEIIHGDVLEWKREEKTPSGIQLGDREYALVANIPYYITGAILESFLEHTPRPERMVLLVQKEVADRIVARDGKESILSVSVKTFGTPNIIAKVPRGAFVPPPDVDSAILAIENINMPKNLDIARFFNILKTGFAHKRKLLIRNLEAIMPSDQLKSIWEQLSFDEKVRAEDMTVENWLQLAEISKKFEGIK